ncbi:MULTISPECIES: competence type IV pilus major pilin ComGC [Enterococcus]|uniref:Prepilin-type N-terminal cleavage/methylation domain-containing protein n=1 Tax=Enterococcus alishanensis TaxID=1303817 RepID=A0ABS6TF90_9ENTE|nr:prepilin-type N-terminal cleavage/methylation domain-containing protein [Enterococcus alishanensis]
MKRIQKGFTLLEMLVVLFVISLLLLLFVPKIMEQRKMAEEKNNAAVVKVVETQIQLYEMEHDGQSPSEGDLVPNYVDAKQYKIYQENKK